ncbi:MAG TPA: hypothetical protein VFF73_24855, partial [Planctomycetota bacterium]|nr:hypothetical protein [Planctomycetota bacterium]
DFLAGRAPRGVDGRVRGAVALVAILIAAGVLVRHERTRGRAGAREVAGELATLARGRLGSDDVASLLLARAAVGIASESGGPEDPGCLETLARAALARGTDALAVAAATSALALAPERRADLLLLRARAKVGLRDEDGALADLVGLGSADAERMRVQALLVGRRTAELLALEGSDPFVVAARAVARCERDLATDDEQRRSAIFESARRELREAPPPFRALLADVRARAEIAAVASLVGARRDAVPPEFAINAATLREPDVLYRPLALAARELGHALESPAFLDPRTDLEALDVALAVIEAGPNSMRSNLEVGEESRGRRREVLELTLALEGIACRIAERPGDCLSHRVRTALTMVRLGGHDEPERRRFLEENVGKGPPLVDSYLRVVLLLCLEADCVAGRVGAREAAGTFAELVEGIDERIPMANNEVGFRADMELTLGELLVRATTEEPTVGAARLEEARRHIALGRAIVERAGQPVVPSRSMGRHVISAEMMLALAEGDREPARRALVEFGQFDGFTKDTAELLFKAELARRGGDLAAAERFLHEAGEIPGSVGFLPTSHWFDFDVAVAGQLLALARGDTRARERLEELETRRAHPALLPWIDKELRQVLAK